MAIQAAFVTIALAHQAKEVGSIHKRTWRTYARRRKGKESPAAQALKNFLLPGLKKGGRREKTFHQL